MQTCFESNRLIYRWSALYWFMSPQFLRVFVSYIWLPQLPALVYLYLPLLRSAYAGCTRPHSLTHFNSPLKRTLPKVDSSLLWNHPVTPIQNSIHGVNCDIPLTYHTVTEAKSPSGCPLTRNALIVIHSYNEYDPLTDHKFIDTMLFFI